MRKQKLTDGETQMRVMKNAGRFKFQVTGVPRSSWSLHFPPSLRLARYPGSTLPRQVLLSVLVQTEFLSLATETPA